MRGRGKGMKVKGQARGRAANMRANQAMKRRMHMARTEANLEFNPAIRAARQEARGLAKREGQITGMYGQLGNEYKQEADAAQAANATAEQATNQRLAEASQRNTGALNEQAEKDQSLAKLVGAPTDAQGLARAAKAAQASESQAAALAAPLTAQRANDVTYLRGRGATATLAAIQAHKDNRLARGKIKTDITAARREKGQATVANLEKAIKADREAAAERAALQLKGQQYGIENQLARARIKVSRSNARISARNASTSAASQAATERHYTNEDRRAARKRREEAQRGGATPAEIRSAEEGRRNAIATAMSLFEQKKWPSWEALEKAVRRESEVSPTDARLAIARLRKHVEREAARGPHGAPH